MEIAYWIAAGITALGFAFTGAFKLVKSKDQLKAAGMNWTDSYSANGIRGIAVAEILGALGLILPPLTGVAVWLAPLAALGLVVIQVGAARAHLKLNETIIPNIVFGVLALVSGVLAVIVWL